MPGDVEIPNAGRGLHCAKGRFSKLAIAQILKLIYLWAHEMATDKNIRRECGIQLSVYPDRLVFMRFVGIFRFFPLSARKRSWKFGFIAIT